LKTGIYLTIVLSHLLSAFVCKDALVHCLLFNIDVDILNEFKKCSKARLSGTCFYKRLFTTCVSRVMITVQEEQPSTSIHYQEKTTIIKTAMKPRQEKDTYMPPS